MQPQEVANNNSSNNYCLNGKRESHREANPGDDSPLEAGQRALEDIFRIGRAHREQLKLLEYEIFIKAVKLKWTLVFALIVSGIAICITAIATFFLFQGLVWTISEYLTVDIALTKLVIGTLTLASLALLAALARKLDLDSLSRTIKDNL